jgi:hypothetical protein
MLKQWLFRAGAAFIGAFMVLRGVAELKDIVAAGGDVVSFLWPPGTLLILGVLCLIGACLPNSWWLFATTKAKAIYKKYATEPRLARLESGQAIALDEAKRSQAARKLHEFTELARSGLPRIEQACRCDDDDDALKQFTLWEIQYGRKMGEILGEERREFDILLGQINSRHGKLKPLLKMLRKHLREY